MPTTPIRSKERTGVGQAMLDGDSEPAGFIVRVEHGALLSGPRPDSCRKWNRKTAVRRTCQCVAPPSLTGQQPSARALLLHFKLGVNDILLATSRLAVPVARRLLRPAARPAVRLLAVQV